MTGSPRPTRDQRSRVNGPTRHRPATSLHERRGQDTRWGERRNRYPERSQASRSPHTPERSEAARRRDPPGRAGPDSDQCTRPRPVRVGGGPAGRGFGPRCGRESRSGPPTFPPAQREHHYQDGENDDRAQRGPQERLARRYLRGRGRSGVRDEDRRQGARTPGRLCCMSPGSRAAGSTK